MARPRFGARRGRGVGGLFIFVLIAAYAVFSLLLVLIGVRVYRGAVDASEQNAQLRTTIGYVSGRVRASDGAVSVRDEGSLPVLRIGRALGEDAYETRIYCAPIDGGPRSGLFEQVVDRSEPFDPDMGELISEVGKFDLSASRDMLLLELVTTGGEAHRMHLRIGPAGARLEGGDAA